MTYYRASAAHTWIHQTPPPNALRMIFRCTGIFWTSFAEWPTCVMASTQIPEPLQCKTVFNRYLSNGRSNPKKSKNEVHFISNFASGRSLPTQSTGPRPIQLVPNTVFLQISQYRLLKSKKFKKRGAFFSRILLLVGPSPPIQLVPNPFNWSPNTVFNRYLSNGRSNQKKSTN